MSVLPSRKRRTGVIIVGGQAMGLAWYVKRGVKRALRIIPNRPPLLRMCRKLAPDEYAPAWELPAPYRLRPSTPGDEGEWVELMNASREFGRWDRERLFNEILSTLLPGGGILAFHEGRLVGCASACLVKKFEPYTTLMYVVALPEHRGKGLGGALVMETLRVSRREGYPGMVLETENHRLAAVRSYFKLGFTPLLVEGAAGRRQWSGVLNNAFLQGQRLSPAGAGAK